MIELGNARLRTCCGYGRHYGRHCPCICGSLSATHQTTAFKQLLSVRRDFLLLTLPFALTLLHLPETHLSFLNLSRHLKNGKRQASSYEGALSCSDGHHSEFF